jgi:hypothetical protein
MSRKIERVEVKLKNGETRTLEYYQPNIAETDENGNLKFICDGGCAYFNICAKLRDPRDPDDKDLCFIDFCQDLGTDSDGNRTDFSNMCPVDGTIESNLGDQDIFQDIIKTNPFVRVTDVIEKVCKGEDGVPFCPGYNEKHTNCVYSNDMCILKSLFPKSKVEE